MPSSIRFLHTIWGSTNYCSWSGTGIKKTRVGVAPAVLTRSRRRGHHDTNTTVTVHCKQQTLHPCPRRQQSDLPFGLAGPWARPKSETKNLERPERIQNNNNNHLDDIYAFARTHAHQPCPYSSLLFRHALQQEDNSLGKSEGSVATDPRILNV